jgi:flavin reductase (DIM6/NTAB) family NADH-FMN oxidoreductase RutF
MTQIAQIPWLGRATMHCNSRHLRNLRNLRLARGVVEDAGTVKTDGPLAAPPMDAAAKKHALRLVPYGLYLAGSKHADGHTAVSLVSWFTQTSFDPPIVVLGLHKDGESLKGAVETGVLAVSVLGATQKDLVKGFFKHVEVKDGKAGALAVTLGTATGCPLLTDLPASLELKVVQILATGDHHTGIFEVVDAHVHHKDMAALDHKTAGLHYAG